MSQTTATTPAKAARDQPSPSNLDLHPRDILLHLIVTLLAPMFLGVCCGNLDFARMAALETVNAYRARSHVDLIAVAQIVAHGLASVSSACLSMRDDISLAMTLKLRANANACDRSAERNRRALEKTRTDPTPDPVSAPAQPPDPEADRKDAEVIAHVAAVTQRAEAMQAQMAAERSAAPAPPAATPATATAAPTAATPAVAAPVAAAPIPPIAAPVSTAPNATAPHATAPHATAPRATAPHATAPHAATTPTPMPAAPAAIPTQPAASADTELTEREIQRMWGAAMTVVANEHAAALANLPANERDAARARAEVLAKTADDLMSGNVPPQPRLGDLRGLMPPNRG